MKLRFRFGRQEKRLRPRSIIRLFQRFGRHLRRHRSKLRGAGLCMLGATAMEILRPWPLKIIFDGILMPQEEPGMVVEFALGLAGGADLLLPLVAVSILSLAILGGLFGFGQSYLISSVGVKVVASIRQELYRHIQRLSHSFHDEHSFGDLLARLTGDIRMMRELMVNAVIYVSARFLVLFGTLAIMLLMDWQLTLVALAIIPFLVFAVGRVSVKIKGAVKRQRIKESKITQVMTERLLAIKVVQAFAREAFEDEKFSRENRSGARAGVVATRLEAQLNRVIQIILAFGTCAVIWFGVTRVQNGSLTPGDLLVFTAYLSGFYKPIRKLAALAGRVAKATVCGERILAILELEPEIKDAPDAVPAPRFRGEIVFENLQFGYIPNTQVFRALDFRVAPGETVALVGESGAGKSTILSLNLRFYDPLHGSVRIDGTDIRRYTLASLRQQIAIVLQDTTLFNASIRDNIAYGKLDASEDEIVAAAKAANAHDFIEGLPNGYETVVGERGATLSGGQRQRIAIARAIVRDAPIVIFDEPMAGLDAENESKVREALTRLMSDRTCLLVTHDPWAAADADRILMLRDEHVIDVSGDPGDGGSRARASVGPAILVGEA